VSEYATESPVSLRRRRQRRRALITIGVVLLGLFFAFWYALSYYQNDATSAQPRAATQTCRTPEPDEVTPDQVTILVLNATNRNGLAARTAKDLAARGFRISGAENDETGRKPPAIAEIRHGPDGTAQAQLVSSTLPKGVKLYNDKRKGTDIDVVLGRKYTELRPEPTPSAEALPTCPSPSGS
jgi:LytR cell envelope-related transcriptional attenuator